MNKKTDCNYPYCDKCNSEFAIPVCMLEEAIIETDNAICIIPNQNKNK